MLISTEKMFDGVREVYRFDNGFGASKVKHKFSYGGDMNLWEIAVLDNAGKVTYSTPVTADVRGHLSDDEAQAVLDQIAKLEDTRGYIRYNGEILDA